MTKDIPESELAKLMSQATPQPETPNPKPGLSDISFQEELDPKAIDELLATPPSEYKPLDFEDPIEFLYFVDDELAAGKKKLWDWQIEELLFIWKDMFDFEERLKHCLTAAN